MRAVIPCALLTLFALQLPVAAQTPAAPATAKCPQEGNISFICGPPPAEDLVYIPGTDWILADSRRNKVEAIRVVSVSQRTVTTIYPSASARDHHDKKKYGGCPGPLAPDDYITHGVSLHAGSNGIHQLYAVHHGSRESVEVFDIDARGALPTATWIGCVIAPNDTVGLNAVVGLADGGFLATNFVPRGSTPQGALERTRKGENSGEVWEWHPASGWEKVPGSESSGPNGLEMSKNGKWLYICAWGGQSLIRLSRGKRVPERTVVALGFRPDNARWASDGTLLVGGQIDGPPPASKVIQVDPRSLKVTTLLERPDSPSFAFATVGVLAAGQIWVGSTRDSSIAIFPAPTASHRR